MAVRARLLALALSAGAFGVALPARAAEQTQAELLFDQARALIEQHRYADAAGKLEASQHLDPSPGTLLNLAECYVQLGRTASAWSTYRAAASLAAGLGQKDRQNYADERADELEGHQATLTLVVPEAARENGLEITVRDVPIAEALYGTPMPTDPGTFAVQASAPGRKPWSQQVTLGKKAQNVELMVPPLAVDKTPVTQQGPAGTRPAEAAGVGSEPPSQPADGNAQRWLGVAFGSAGLIAAGVGTYLYFEAESTIADAKCPNSRCVEGIGDPDLHERGRKREQISLGVLAAGGALAAAGVALVLSAPDDSSALAGRGLRLVAAGAPTIAELGIAGTFY